MKVQGALVSYQCGCLDWLSGGGYGARLRTCPSHTADLERAERELGEGKGRDLDEVLAELSADLTITDAADPEGR